MSDLFSLPKTGMKTESHVGRLRKIQRLSEILDIDFDKHQIEIMERLLMTQETREKVKHHVNDNTDYR